MSVRDKLLTPIITPKESVPIPELGEDVSVIVQGMTAGQKNAFDLQFTKDGQPNPKTQKQARERMLVACCVNEDGTRMFTLEDVAALSLQYVKIVERIFDACQRVNGITEAAPDYEKNSD